MASFVVTVEDAVVADAKALLSSVEGAVITDVLPELETGLLSFLQNSAKDVVAAVGALLTRVLGTPSSGS